MSTATATRRSKADPTTGLEFKTSAAQIQELGPTGKFRIYGAIFNNVDRANEKIVPGAFSNLDEFEADGFMAAAHKWDLPIATISSATQDKIGLLVTGEFHSTPEAQACRRVMVERRERGKQVFFSIGYRVVSDKMATEAGKSVRVLTDLELYEVSWVTVPANPLAVALDVKAAGYGRKEGRILSGPNHARLSCAAKGIRDAVEEHLGDIEALLDETDPDTMETYATPKSAHGAAVNRARADYAAYKACKDVEITAALHDYYLATCPAAQRKASPAAVAQALADHRRYCLSR